MSNLINAATAHTIADQANERRYSEWVREVHASLKSRAQRGAYSANISVPSEYSNKSLAILQYFSMFGYTVSLNRGTVTVGW